MVLIKERDSNPNKEQFFTFSIKVSSHLNEILIPKTKTKFWELGARTQLKPVPIICQISAGN